MKIIQLDRQRGFTIVELMVAMVIGLILLGGLMQVFLSNKQSYKLQEASSNVQENGRFGMSFLTKDIRMIGFMGCGNTNTIAVTNNVDPTSVKVSSDIGKSLANFDGNNALKGFRYTGGSLPTEISDLGLTAAEIVQGTDLFYMERGGSCPGGDVVCSNNTSGNKTCPQGALNAASYKIADNTECNIQQNDVILVSDCNTADVHFVTNNVGTGIFANIAHGSNGNLTPKLSNSYGEGSAIYKMTADVYYIGFGASGEPALYRRRLIGDTFANEELVEGIYNMELRYGEDSNGDGVANRYVAAADVTNWTDVASVQVKLYTRSLQDKVVETPVTYTYNGASVTDRRLLRDFTFTTTIRNRVQ
jgi:type IV pilus assembly protein PilW